MLVFVAFGYLAWIAFLLAVLVLAGIVWSLCHLVLGIDYLIRGPGPQKGKVAVKHTPPPVQRRVTDPAPLREAPPRAAPPVRDREPHPAQTLASSEIWPKWTPAHRRYVDEEMTLWQEQFDALSARQ